MLDLKNTAIYFTTGAAVGTGLALNGYVPFTGLALGAAGAFCVAQNFFGDLIYNRVQNFVFSNFSIYSYRGQIKAALLTLSHILAGASIYAHGLLAVKVGLIAAGTLNPVAIALLIGAGTAVALARFSYHHFQYYAAVPRTTGYYTSV